MANPKESPSSKEATETTEKTKNEEIFDLIGQLDLLDLRFNKRTEEGTKALQEIGDKYQAIATSLSPEEKKELEHSMHLLATAIMDLNTFGFLTNKDQKAVERTYEGLPYHVSIDFRALQTLANSGVALERRGDQLVFTGITYKGTPSHIATDSATRFLQVRQTDFIHSTVEIIASNFDRTEDKITVEGGQITKVENIGGKQ